MGALAPHRPVWAKQCEEMLSNRVCLPVNVFVSRDCINMCVCQCGCVWVYAFIQLRFHSVPECTLERACVCGCVNVCVCVCKGVPAHGDLGEFL